MKTKQIEVIPYQESWPVLFQKEAQKIKAALGNACVDVHHIGSTSVPGLAAKDTLDIVCVVTSLTASLKLQDIGYAFRGELNIPLRYYFTKRPPNQKVNLHVVEPGHGFIDLNLKFKQYLCQHEDVKNEYANLKYKLLKQPDSTQQLPGEFAAYTLRKNDFIKRVLNAANVQSVVLNFCMHELEWKAFEELLALPKPLSEDAAFCFVLYAGTQIVGAAMLTPTHKNILHLQGLKAISLQHQNYLTQKLIQWAQHHKYQIDSLEGYPQVSL